MAVIFTRYKRRFFWLCQKRSVKPAVSDWCFADWRIEDADWRNFVPDKNSFQNRRFANQKFEEFHHFRNEVTLIQVNVGIISS